MNSDIATSAKLGGRAGLQELLGAASPGPWEYGDVTVTTQNAEIRLASEMDAKLAAAAPDLARLVLDLAEALDSAAALCSSDSDPEGSIWSQAQATLAAVEEL